VKANVADLFDHFANDAESYGAENLYLARRDEGYVGDPKEFRFSEIYARRIPMYKYELIVDYIDEAAKSPHEKLGRRLTAAEANWMRREAKKLYEEEFSHAPAGAKKKRARQLDVEIADALSASGQRRQMTSRLQPVEGLRIPADARRELTRFWQGHPELRTGCLHKYGFDPIDEAMDYWRFGLAEPAHVDLLRAVRRNGGVFSLPLVKRWEAEELRHT
jgi:hypothetical protein